MSTNFYLRNKQQYQTAQKANANVKLKIEEIIKEIESIVDDEDKVKSIKWDLTENAEVGYEEIHIGKRSGGWKPTFEKQKQFSSVKELEAFYENNQDTYEIINEYDEVLDWDGLVNELITWNPNGKESIQYAYKDEEGYLWNDYKYS